MKTENEKVGTTIAEMMEYFDAETKEWMNHGLAAFSHLKTQNSPVMTAVRAIFNALPTKTQKALILLGRQGWYIDLNMPMPDLWQTARLFLEDKVDEAEMALVDYFESREKEIENSIKERFPHRGHIIKAAFKAHRKGDYVLSIPVMLSQTDGICKELIDHELFIKDHGKPDTANYLTQIAADTFKAALLSPISVTLPINASKKERPNGLDSLNRHMVLHGESINYGTRINSLKAISLINYIAHTFNPDEKK